MKIHTRTHIYLKVCWIFRKLWHSWGVFSRNYSFMCNEYKIFFYVFREKSPHSYYVNGICMMWCVECKFVIFFGLTPHQKYYIFQRKWMVKKKKTNWKYRRCTNLYMSAKCKVLCEYQMWMNNTQTYTCRLDKKFCVYVFGSVLCFTGCWCCFCCWYQCR